MTGTIGRCEMTEELLGVLRSFRIFYLHKNEQGGGFRISMETGFPLY